MVDTEKPALEHWQARLELSLAWERVYECRQHVIETKSNSSIVKYTCEEYIER